MKIATTLLVVTIAFHSFAQTWQQTNGPYGGDVRCIVINSEQQVYIGTRGGGVYHSSDNGSTWNQVNNGLTAKDVWAIAVNQNSDLFAGTSGGGAFRSTDNGANWTQIN